MGTNWLARYIKYGLKVLSSRGLTAFFLTGWHFLKAKLLKGIACFTTERDQARLTQILQEHQNLSLLVTRPLLDWDVPLFQRHHHLALTLSKCGFLYFYCTDNWANDNVLGFKEIAGNLFLTNRADLLEQSTIRKVFILSSTDNYTTLACIERELNKGNLVVYDYLDEIHDEISGLGVPQSTYLRHEALLKDERCIVIATADKLYRDVLAHRTSNCALVTNGVEYDHFAHTFGPDEMPAELRAIKATGRAVIGYFGALASWFDYELVLKVVQERPDIEFVLLGWNYDGSMEPFHLEQESRIHVIGPVAYRHLPRYACWFDVATIPFVINEITESTSPIKLFEYMALGKPIVTTDMPECRKYESVMVAKSHVEFVTQLDRALALREDKGYHELLKREALENTWDAKARAIADLITSNLKG